MENRRYKVTNPSWQEILQGHPMFADPIAIDTYDDVDARYQKAMGATDEEFARLLGKHTCQTAAEPDAPPELQEF